MEDRIIAVLSQAGKPLSLEAVAEQLGAELPVLEAAVQALMGSGKVLITRKRRLALPEQTGLLYGKIQGHARGFGFFRPEDGSADAFIPADGMHGAMNGDMVWARLTDQVSRNGSPEAEVCAIVKRAYSQIVGTFEQEDKAGGYVVPDDTRLPMDVMIPADRTLKAKPGDKVVAQVLQFPDGRRPILGAIREVLGNKDDAGTDVLSIIRQFQLPEQFSKGAARQAKLLKQTVAKDAYISRENLKGKCIVTIDGADSRDLDDAVSLERFKNGNYYLGVHIADVSAYVKEGSALDRDALERGTSVYFPDRVIPMLPVELSNGICSLNEGSDRLTLSCFMEIDQTGKVLSHRIAETMICSRHRLVYDDVTKLLQGDEEQLKRYDDIAPMLKDLETLAGVLNAKRVKRGSIDFDLDETKIAVDAQGRPVQVGKAERGIANRIIEECMLIANETVAEHVALLNLPFLYRVHETPEKEKLAELNVFLQTLGYGIRNVKDIQPRALQRVLESAKGTKEENIVSKVVLRSMKRARYCEACLGHFGLAAKHYCHFTSPIRRYPDLMGHRILKEMIHGELNAKRVEALNAKLPEMARQCSEREKIATDAERAVEDLKKCEYMKERIGETWAGVIAGVTSFGFFVELANTVEGLVKMTSLDDDYYVYDEKNYRMVGRSSGRVYRLGDEVKVRVVAVDMEAHNIDFELATENGQKLSRPKGKEPDQINIGKENNPESAKTGGKDKPAAPAPKRGRRRGGARRPAAKNSQKR